MKFFDCNTFIGLPASPPAAAGPVGPGVSAEELLAAMDRAGIERALVRHIAQYDQDPITGNELLAEAIAPHERLVGCWALLPPQTGELGNLDGWFAAAAAARIRAFCAFPQVNRYLLRDEVVGDVLERLIAARMPLILSIAGDQNWETAYDILVARPDLTVIISELRVWGADRFFRPLIERYPNVYVEISGHNLDGGIEAFVNDYGAARLLYGSGFPRSYHGGMMLALACAEISDEDKQAIAAGNIERLLGQVKL